MNFSLHLTDNCNMRCTYCIAEPHQHRMSQQVLLAACDLAFSVGKTAGLCFFGGEPLLEKELIAAALDYCRKKSVATKMPFRCNMTTNGTLLTAEFLHAAKQAGMVIGLSFDGLMQDTCRRFANGSGTFQIVEKNARLLLQEMPQAYAAMTIAPETAAQCAASVRYLCQLGFHNIIATPAYGNRVHWTDDALERLRISFLEIAEFYESRMQHVEPFFFSPFDAKIRETIRGKSPSARCHLGVRQMSIAPDGKLYPCTQFVGDAAYCLGDVFNGIDLEKQRGLVHKQQLPDSCRICSIRHRCTNACACLNRMETGNESKVSPMQCSYERMLISICDALANRLIETCQKEFLQRFCTAGI